MGVSVAPFPEKSPQKGNNTEPGKGRTSRKGDPELIGSQSD